MASAELRHRTKEEDGNIDDTRPIRPNKKSGMAKRGLRSLALAIALPLSLTVLDITFFGSSQRLRMSKPSYFPPLWALHLASLGSAVLMGLSAWLVWAEGGFHRNPNALMVYLGQLGLGLAWGPVVFGAGASWVGLVLCIGLVATLVGCSRMFRVVNPIAGHLVMPCLLSAGLLAITNLRLVYR